MGVQGLWTLVQPSARPVQLERLRNRKLAIDASIWIYQFLRTMRSSDGNALRHGYILGFFRRLCKLLFYNIKPVFVFDGAAPTMKLATMRTRQQRRQGVQSNIKRTAQKILNAQLMGQAVYEEQKRRQGIQEETEASNGDEESYTYLEQLDHAAAVDHLRHQNKIKQDQYELPPEAPVAARPGAIDPRLATKEELLDFVSEFRPADIDMDSETFQALPPEIQYEIIQDIKLRSRQTSYARLQTMVSNSKTAMDFSKQQIVQLGRRNDMTQRVLQMNNMASKPTNNQPGRVASERGRSYVLVKNENIEEGLGWRLPGVSVRKDDDKKQGAAHTAPEPPLVLQMHDHGEMKPEMQESDPVRRALASNPALASLAATLDDDEDDDEDEDGVDEEENELADDSDDPVARAMAKRPDLIDLVSQESSASPSPLPQPHAPRPNIPVPRFIDHRPKFSMSRFQLEAPDQYASLMNSTSHAINNLSSQDSALGAEFDLEDDDQDEDEFASYEDYSDDDDQPLFYANAPDNPYLSQRVHTGVPQLPDTQETDEQVTVDSEEMAVDQILWRIYDKKSPSDEKSDSSAPPMLPQIQAVDPVDVSPVSPQDYYDQWLSCVADDFVYAHSLNDEYKTLLAAPIFDDSINEINDKLRSVRKSFGKSSSANPLHQNALAFHLRFLEAVAHWKTLCLQHEKNQQPEIILLSDDDDSDKDVPIVFMNKESPKSPKSPKDRILPANGTSLANNGTTAAPVLQANLGKSFLAPAPRQDTTPSTPEQPKDTIDTTNTVFSTTPVPTDDESTVNQSVASLENEKENAEDKDDKKDDTKEGIMDTEDTEDKKDDNDDNLAPVPFMSEEEEEKMMENADEEAAEFARFVSDLQSRDLSAVQQEIQRDLSQLTAQKQKQMAHADTVTQQMVQDIQHLLQLFGVPYVVAPMEAEAQCAFLLQHDLVDGIVTDDSDCFLFGGVRIYRNMFQQLKYVECYVLNDIERDMSISRTQLIQLAYFLGSDYTPGLTGIGPVAALEILANFQEKGEKHEDKDPVLAPLHRFKDWYEKGVDTTSFEKSFRRQHKHLDIPDDFPNPLVKDAYLHPMVDESLEKFNWAAPQVDTLRVYLKKTFDWPEEKVDEVLLPVIREMNKRQMEGIQPTLSNYFDPSAGLSSTYKRDQKVKHKSKRIQKAVDAFRKRDNDQSSVTSDDDDDDDTDDSEIAFTSPPAKKQKRSPLIRTTRSRRTAK
ncbi:hypothetical protein BC940DRAFT_270793 [Gongronella butleri]|nr:hypothetical protein BC940DRAFT_270793 [Gongronella butleri]